jgi:hypothetical protein
MLSPNVIRGLIALENDLDPVSNPHCLSAANRQRHHSATAWPTSWLDLWSTTILDGRILTTSRRRLGQVTFMVQPAQNRRRDHQACSGRR